MRAPILICGAVAASVLTALWLAGSLRPAGPAAKAVCVEYKLLASDGGKGDLLARDYALDISGNVAVGGCGTKGTRRSGAAYVFRFDGTNWSEEAKLRPADAWKHDHFGRLVAVSGDVVVVSAYGDDDNGYLSGSAYVFRYNGADWVEEAKLLPSDGKKEDGFPSVVSIDGDVIAVGAMFTDDLGENSGSGYIFRFDGTQWVEEAKLLASDGMMGDRFGRAASVHGNLAIFGAVRDTVDGKLSGSIYVLRYDGTKWNQEATLAPSDGADLDWFGRYVDVHGDLIIGGANKHSHLDYFESGAAYIFRYDGEQWVEEAELLASDMAHKDWFGRSVAIYEDMAVVGSHRTYDNGKHSGSAYVFRFDGTRWVEELKLLPSDGAAWDFFGRSCSLTGDWLLVGSNQDDDLARDSGAMYVFPASVGTESCIAQNRGCEGDVNGDNTVDAYDSGFVLTQISCHLERGDPDCKTADANRDGRVDSLDVDFILARFEQQCEDLPARTTSTGRCRSSAESAP